MTKDEAMKLALEWMETIVNSNWRNWGELASPEEFERWVKTRANHSAVVLRQALEQPRQECETCANKRRRLEQAGFLKSPLRGEETRPEQEPVAWYEQTPSGDWFLAYSHNPNAVTRPLVYLDIAPPKREWVGLTDEEGICDEWERITGHNIDFEPKSEGRAMYLSADEVIEFARSIEAKLKEKNRD